jgi:hypothetical protein
MGGVAALKMSEKTNINLQNHSNTNNALIKKVTLIQNGDTKLQVRPKESNSNTFQHFEGPNRLLPLINIDSSDLKN